tara:strand:- start:102 stop:278 length:177 start_codon:yes stop_codon:yes gene_type:complete
MDISYVFHRLETKELEEAVIQYLATRKQRHDLVTIMINNKCSFSLSEQGELEISKEIV